MHVCKWVFYKYFLPRVKWAAFAPHSQSRTAVSSVSLLFNGCSWFLRSVRGWLTPLIFLEWYMGLSVCNTGEPGTWGNTCSPCASAFSAQTAVSVWPRGPCAPQRSLLGRWSWSCSQMYTSVQFISLSLPSHVSSRADERDATFKQNMGAQFVRIAKNASGNTSSRAGLWAGLCVMLFRTWRLMFKIFLQEC